jgi:hypothetical protein
MPCLRMMMDGLDTRKPRATSSITRLQRAFLYPLPAGLCEIAFVQISSFIPYRVALVYLCKRESMVMNLSIVGNY